MNETVSVDSKGRLVLPKKTRLEAGIDVNHRLVVRTTGIGRLELLDTSVLIAKAQEIGSKKLAGWDEADHEPASYVRRLMKQKRGLWTL